MYHFNIMWQEMKYIIIIAMLLRCLSCQTLRVEIDGNLSNGTKYCKGEIITLYCQHSGVDYIWSFSSNVDSMLVSPSIQQVWNISTGYSATYLHENGSSLSFRASDFSNNTVIYCSSSSSSYNLSTLVDVYGVLPVPQVVVDQRATTQSSLHLRLLQTEPSAVCVTYYTIFVTNLQTSYTYTSKYPVENVWLSKVVIPNQELCKYNFSIRVVGQGYVFFVSDPYEAAIQLTFEGIKWYSHVTSDKNALRWSVNPDLSHCISGFEYYFKVSEITGILPKTATSLPIDKFNLSSQCSRETVTISPIFYARPDPLRNIGAKYDIPVGDNSSNNTKYKVAFAVIMVLGSFILFALGGIIFFLIKKVKKLKRKLVEIQKAMLINNDDESFNEDNLGKKSLLEDQSYYDSADPSIGMTGNNAYGIEKEDPLEIDCATVIYESV